DAQEEVAALDRDSRGAGLGGGSARRDGRGDGEEGGERGDARSREESLHLSSWGGDTGTITRRPPGDAAPRPRPSCILARGAGQLPPGRGRCRAYGTASR